MFCSCALSGASLRLWLRGRSFDGRYAAPIAFPATLDHNIWATLTIDIKAEVMNTITLLRKSLLSVALLPLLVNASAPARGTLRLDGILALRGSNEAQGRVVVFPLDAPEFVLEHVEGRFTTDLSLDHAYLLSFERTGMVTKQIYFDTSVPVERHASTMEFPFKVTLNPEGRDGVFAYAGPVGIVRYIAAIDDFGYETDYTLKAGAPMVDRIVQLMGRSSVEAPVLTPVVASATTVAPRSSEEGTDRLNTRAATLRNEAPMVNRIVYEKPVQIDAIGTPGTPVEPSVTADPVADLGTVAVDATEGSRIEANTTMEKSSGPQVLAATEDQRIQREELIVDRQRVTTVVRVIGANGRETEYRRVADGRGSVLYFQDGRSIPAYLYHAGTGR